MSSKTSQGLPTNKTQFCFLDTFPPAFMELHQWFSVGGGHWAMSKDIFRFHSWVEARDAAKRPTMHRTAPCNKDLSRRKCQYCSNCETLSLTSTELQCCLFQEESGPASASPRECTCSCSGLPLRLSEPSPCYIRLTVAPGHCFLL